MFKNMKIEINSEQPLEEVIKEVERLGYTIIGAFKSQRLVYTTESGSVWFANIPIYSGELTTLSQLKQMEN